MKTLDLKNRLGLDRFFLGERPVAGQAFILNQRRIFILPTQRGLGFALLLVLLMLIAFVYNNNLAYLLVFLLASIFFISILHTYNTLAGLQVQEGQATAVFAGEQASVGVQITNPSRIVREHVQVGITTPESFSLNANSEIHIGLSVPTQHRGQYPIGTVTLASSYPLGLFRAWSPIRFSGKIWVYPQPCQQTMAWPENDTSAGQQGQFKKGGDEFYGLQSYQIGNPIRHIHWKAYAKGLGLYSKQFGSESRAEIWLDFSQTPGQSLEERLSQLCRWVVDAEQAGLRYGFILPNLRLEPSNGHAHCRQCLEALALY